MCDQLETGLRGLCGRFYRHDSLLAVAGAGYLGPLLTRARETRATGFIMPPLLSNSPSDSPNWPPFADPSHPRRLPLDFIQLGSREAGRG